MIELTLLSETIKPFKEESLKNDTKRLNFSCKLNKNVAVISIVAVVVIVMAAIIAYLSVLKLTRKSCSSESKELLNDLETFSITCIAYTSDSVHDYNCTLSKAPLANTLNFLLDKKSIVDIQHHNGLCYKSLLLNDKACSADECYCSPDGLQYVWTYTTTETYSSATFGAKFSNNCKIAATVNIEKQVSYFAANSTKCLLESNAASLHCFNVAVLMLCLTIQLTANYITKNKHDY